MFVIYYFFFSSRRRHTRLQGDWSSDVCSSDLGSVSNNGSRASARKSDCLSTSSSQPARGADRRPRSSSPASHPGPPAKRSEERRVGKECRSWWAKEP